MKKAVAIILCLASLTACSSRPQGDAVLSAIPNSGSSYTDFIPKGCDTLATEEGDLNKDGLADFVMVLKSKTEDTSSQDVPRYFIVLFRSGSGYKLAAKTGKAILCKECGGVFGDPFEGITISKGVLTIDHYGGSADRWSLQHKFRYQDGGFYLIGATMNAYSTLKNCDNLGEFANTDFQDTNFVTGQYAVKKVSEDCKLIADKKGKFAVRPLRSLDDFNIDNQ